MVCLLLSLLFYRTFLRYLSDLAIFMVALFFIIFSLLFAIKRALYVSFFISFYSYVHTAIELPDSSLPAVSPKRPSCHQGLRRILGRRKALVLPVCRSLLLSIG